MCVFMPWIIGIDEAGYGPNLGPFVMTSVATRVPGKLAGADLWRVLRAVVRRHPSQEDGRLLIEDSRLVYSSDRGLLELETGVIATLSPWPAGEATPLNQFLSWLHPSHHGELASEPWYLGTSLVPMLATPADLAGAADRFAGCCRKKEIVWGLVRSVIICPQPFNELLDHWGSKGAVLGQALAELARGNRELEDDTETLIFLVHKPVGRHD